MSLRMKEERLVEPTMVMGMRVLLPTMMPWEQHNEGEE